MKLADQKPYIERLTRLWNNGDIKVNHFEADKVLCDLLNELGYEAVVAAWRQVPKWYA